MLYDIIFLYINILFRNNILTKEENLTFDGCMNHARCLILYNVCNTTVVNTNKNTQQSRLV